MRRCRVPARRGQSEAVIDDFGNLILNFQTNVTRIRFLQYDYGTTPPAGLDGDGSRHYLSTIEEAAADVPLQNIRAC